MGIKEATRRTGVACGLIYRELGCIAKNGLLNRPVVRSWPIGLRADAEEVVVISGIGIGTQDGTKSYSANAAGGASGENFFLFVLRWVGVPHLDSKLQSSEV